MKTVTWVQPEDLLRHELWQADREISDPDGRAALQRIRSLWTTAGGVATPPHQGASPELGDRGLRPLAERLLGKLATLTATVTDPSWPALEAAARPRVEALGPVPRSTDVETLEAAWTGRIVGCVLGKPVEKIPREGIEDILRATGRWPLQAYFTDHGLPQQVADRWPWNTASRPTCLEENIDGIPEDDDLNYTLMALRLLESAGPDFDSGDVADGWLADLPAARTFTAERIAYRNLLCGLEPPATGSTGNPFREWIGAQIRTDLYGWVNPGDPLRAAELAYRDAVVSHTRDGVFTAMAVAAMTSVAVTPDAHVDTVLDTAIAVIPAGSGAASALRFGRELAELPPLEAYPLLEERYAGMHWVHALNNTALLAYALAHTDGEFAPAICTVVAGGWDTDSNGATVGGIAGALCGSQSIDSYWTRPLHGTLRTSIPGADGSTIGDLARRTAALRRTP